VGSRSAADDRSTFACAPSASFDQRLIFTSICAFSASFSDLFLAIVEVGLPEFQAAFRAGLVSGRELTATVVYRLRLFGGAGRDGLIDVFGERI
jgi:hypothetical protein